LTRMLLEADSSIATRNFRFLRYADLSSRPDADDGGGVLLFAASSQARAKRGPRLSTTHARYEMSEMGDLPENLLSLGDEEPLEARDACDAKLRPLFRRWPSLSRPEAAELKRVYNERVRLAKWIGRTRRKRNVAR
jgi:hypothetical protein